MHPYRRVHFTMKSFLALVVTIASILLLQNARSAAEDVSTPLNLRADAATKLNVLFIMSDDQDLHMSSMSYMPKVGALLADKGTTFSNHYCTTALCCPSRISLLTGRCVHNTNVTNVRPPYGAWKKVHEDKINDDYLPLWLQDGGINTYYVGKLSNGHSIGNYQKRKAKGWTGSNFLLEPGQYDYVNTTWAKNGNQWKNFPGENAVTITTNHSLEMLETAIKANKPFFMAVAPAVPHVGLNASGPGSFFPIPQRKWENAFKNATVPEKPNWNPDTTSGVGWVRELPKQDEAIVNTLNKFYRQRIRCIAGLDDMVGDLVAMLDKHGILENTHVIYTTDNGYHIGQHRLGPGKKMGFESDINIPMVWRGPGVASGKVSTDVTNHTDLAPTWLDIFAIKQRGDFDGTIMPVTGNVTRGASDHVNVEFWGEADPYEAAFHKITVPGQDNNTYKSVRIINDDYSLYYSVWCTNEHELYNMKAWWSPCALRLSTHLLMQADYYQMDNLLPNVLKVPDEVPNQQYLGHPLKKVVQRLDAVLMVLKSCTRKDCIKPWSYLHPQGNVENLMQALEAKYDDFYANQQKVSFSKCGKGYRVAFEGPQKAHKYKGSQQRPITA